MFTPLIETSTGPNVYAYPVYYNSTGQLEENVSQELSDMLAPEIGTSGLSFNEWWEALGRTFYIRYWLHLADLGQTSAKDPSSNLTDPYVYPSTTNPFVNETLYQNFLAFYENLDPPSEYLGNLLPFPDFTPLQPVDTMFQLSYSCEQLRLKSGVSLLISIIAADYAFIVGGYSLLMCLAGNLQKRKEEGTQTHLDNIEINLKQIIVKGAGR